MPGSSKKILTVGCAVLFATAAAPAQTAATPATKPTQAASASPSPSSGAKISAHRKHKGKRSPKTANWRKHGQQKIDTQRTREIQEALIREHYLQGESSGVWDDSTEKALQRYQADNGWQSKSTPDARALIKLGLGPDQGHLLNPDSAMTMTGTASQSAAPQSASPKASQSAAPADPPPSNQPAHSPAANLPQK